MGLAMFGLILDRVLALTHEAYTNELHRQQTSATTTTTTSDTPIVHIADALTEDARILLPAIKVWCDWLLANMTVWNPPPPLAAFTIGHPTVADPWTLLARLVSLLERIKPAKRYIHINAPDASDVASELVRLPEDIALLGFAPLDPHLDLEPVYCDRTDDLDVVHTVYRIKRIVFLCTKFFTHCEPPVLWRRGEAGETVEYRSAVGGPAGGHRQAVHGAAGAEQCLDDMMLVESFSDDEADAIAAAAERTEAEQTTLVAGECNGCRITLNIFAPGSNLYVIESRYRIFFGKSEPR